MDKIVKAVLATERKRDLMLIDDCFGCVTPFELGQKKVAGNWHWMLLQNSSVPNLSSRIFSSFKTCALNAASGDMKFSSKAMERMKSLWSIETLHLMAFSLSVTIILTKAGSGC